MTYSRIRSRQYRANSAMVLKRDRFRSVSRSIGQPLAFASQHRSSGPHGVVDAQLLPGVHAEIKLEYDHPGYSRAIPIDMLRRAGQIKAQFKDAVFAVTDYQAVNPDPFISVTLPTFSEPVIFGVWDEPGFGAIGKDA